LGRNRLKRFAHQIADLAGGVAHFAGGLAFHFGGGGFHDGVHDALGRFGVAELVVEHEHWIIAVVDWSEKYLNGLGRYSLFEILWPALRYCAPSGLFGSLGEATQGYVRLALLTLGLALGCHIAPFQGFVLGRRSVSPLRGSNVVE
jgi:hypothetical protein